MTQEKYDELIKEQGYFMSELQKLVEKVLVRLEKISNLSVKKSGAVLPDESSKNIIEADQPKLF